MVFDTKKLTEKSLQSDFRVSGAEQSYALQNTCFVLTANTVILVYVAIFIHVSDCVGRDPVQCFDRGTYNAVETVLCIDKARKQVQSSVWTQ